MDPLAVTMEVDRIRNLISNFGWKIVKQKITEKELELVIERLLPAPVKTEPDE